MAGRIISVKRYVVRLSGEERGHLEAMLRKGNHGMKTPIKAGSCSRRRSPRRTKARATARSSSNWKRARRWSIACAKSWWRKASPRF